MEPIQPTHNTPSAQVWDKVVLIIQNTTGDILFSIEPKIDKNTWNFEKYIIKPLGGKIETLSENKDFQNTVFWTARSEAKEELWISLENSQLNYLGSMSSPYEWTTKQLHIVLCSVTIDITEIELPRWLQKTGNIGNLKIHLFEIMNLVRLNQERIVNQEFYEDNIYNPYIIDQIAGIFDFLTNIKNQPQ